MKVFENNIFAKKVNDLEESRNWNKFSAVVRSKITKFVTDGSYISGNVLCGDKNTICCTKRRLVLRDGSFRLILIINLHDDILILENIYLKKDQADLTPSELKEVKINFDTFCKNKEEYIETNTTSYDLIKM
jgi:hypothetical protein